MFLVSDSALTDIEVKNGLLMSAKTNPTFIARPFRYFRASRVGSNFKSRIANKTLFLKSSFTYAGLFKTLLTVPTEVSAKSATSLSVARLLLSTVAP